MRGPMIVLALGALLVACNSEEPSPAPPPTPSATASDSPPLSSVRPDFTSAAMPPSLPSSLAAGGATRRSGTGIL